MSDDFDNDDLSWLRDDDPGDTPPEDGDEQFDWQEAGQPDQPHRPQEDQLGFTGELSWLQDDDGEPGAERDADRLGMTGELPWLQDDDGEPGAERDADRLGMTGELPWLQGDDEANDSEDADAHDWGTGEFAIIPDGFEETDGDEADSPADVQHVTADLNLPDWLRSGDPDWINDPAGEGEPAAPRDPVDWSQSSAGSLSDLPADDEPDWLLNETAEDDTPVSSESGLPPWLQDEPATSDDPLDDVPDWLLGLDDVQTEATPYTVGGKLSEDWLAQGEALPETNETELTFDEWAAQQAAAARTPELDELLPDSFSDLEDAGPVTPDDIDTGALPGWFLGMEELDTSDAPDWFTETDPTAPSSPTEPMADTVYDDPAPTLSLDDFLSTVEVDHLPEAEVLADDEVDEAAHPAEMPASLTDSFGDDFFTSLGISDESQSPEAGFELEHDEEAEQPVQEYADDFFSSLVASGQTDDLPEPSMADFGDDFLSSIGMEAGDALPPEAEAEPESPQLAPLPDAFFTSLGVEAQPETEFEQPTADDFDLDSLFAAEADSIEPVEFDPALPDGEFLSALGIENNAEAEPYNWFAEAEQGITEEVDDADWLGELGELEDLPAAEAEPLDDDFFADLGAPAPVRPSEAEFQDLDSLLASLDEVNEQNALPSTGALTGSEEVDFDNLFSDPAFADIEPRIDPETGFERSDLLTELGATVGTASAAAYLRQQRDRPLDELPDRLKRLRDQAEQIGSAAQPESQTLTDFLPGVTDGLAAGTLEIDAGSLASGITITPDQQRRIDILRTLTASDQATPRAARSAIDLTYDSGFLDDDEAFPGLGAEEAPAEEADLPVPLVQRPRRIKLNRLLITLLVGAAVIAPFFLRPLRIGGPPPVSFGADSRQQDAFNILGTLRPGDFVLVGAEYGPTAAGELDSLLQVTLQHILLQRAIPVIVSGNPVALLRADNLLAELAEDQTFLLRLGRTAPLEANTDYSIVRYLPGGSVGLRSLGTGQLTALLANDIHGQATGLNTLSGLDGFAAVVIVAERPTDLRNWAEQVAPLTGSPIIAATTFAASPLAEPYLGAVLDGLLVGYPDALAYDALLLAGAQAVPPGEIDPQQPPVDATDSLQATATITPTTTPTQVLPTVTSTPLANGVITATSTINLREGPSAGSPVVGSLQPGDLVQVIGQDDSGAWVNVRLPSGGIEGWVSSNLIVVRGAGDAPANTPLPLPTNTTIPAPTSTPLPTQTAVVQPSATLPPTNTTTPVATSSPTQSPTPIPTVITARVTGTDRINVRSGPGTSFAPVGTAGPGEEFTVIGRNSAGDWIRVEFPDVEEAWIAAFLLNISAEQVPETSSTSGGVQLVRGGGIAFAPYRVQAQATEEATAEVSEDPAAAPQPQVGSPVLRTLPYAEERWYSMTLGLVVIIIIIVFGALVNILRALRRRRN